jgi:hypothetical protein
MEFGDFPMMRMMLQGFKARAEEGDWMLHPWV